ncbi:MAG: protein phosphatase 2C domain-containing protein, partial [Oscillospiraceae bacterium]
MINIYTSTHQGLVRKQNQDFFDFHIYENGEMAFVIVCDGMGGENAGEVASKLACDTIKTQILKTNTKFISPSNIKSILESAISVANSKVFDASQSDEKYGGMGTTVVVMFLIGSEIFVMYAGDSRAYIIGGNKINQITKDHTVVQSLVDAGEITCEEAQSHPQKHFITRALGV